MFTQLEFDILIYAYTTFVCNECTKFAYYIHIRFEFHYTNSIKRLPKSRDRITNENIQLITLSRTKYKSSNKYY